MTAREMKMVKIKQIKKEANNVKSKLMELQDQVQEYSKADAEALEKIIIKLELWQNK